MSGQGEPNSALWLPTRASKMALSCRIGITRCVSREKLVLSVPNTKILHLCSKIYVAYLAWSAFILWKLHNWNYMNSWYLGLHLSSTHNLQVHVSEKTVGQFLNLLFIFIPSSLWHVVLDHVKMAAAAWSNVTENANVSVQRGTPESTVKTLLQQKHYVRDTIETFHL